jgi:hypothetical protein
MPFHCAAGRLICQANIIMQLTEPQTFFQLEEN